MTHRIFIDGQAGTTGLEIHARLREQSDLDLLEIDPQRRKDPAARRELLNAADAVILCLPDEAAREAVALIDAPHVRVLDASSAHRTAPDWVYGLPELVPGQDAAIAGAQRVANPGCYPTGFLLLTRPLVDAQQLRRDAVLSIHALSGYTGGGRAMVERYEADAARASPALLAPRAYGLTLAHKHLAEMQHWAGLASPPLFAPMVGPFARGMLVQVPLTPAVLQGAPSAAELTQTLADRYREQPCIRVHPAADPALLVDGGFLEPQACNGTNAVDLVVFGDGPRMLLIARLDNLGKGAGGAAVQNLNLMLGRPEFTGLHADPVHIGDAVAADAGLRAQASP